MPDMSHACFVSVTDLIFSEHRRLKSRDECRCVFFTELMLLSCELRAKPNEHLFLFILRFQQNFGMGYQVICMKTDGTPRLGNHFHLIYNDWPVLTSNLFFFPRL